MKDGREYLVEEYATKVNGINEVSHQSMLLQRIGHDQNQENKKSGFAP
ncbi:MULTISPECIES: hypothetical protein [unclassified Arsenophonus]|nr:hypothetical protein [Arsenophonus sp.]MDR5615597.1 hypothetical protein [Arsenophonus sp.]